MPTSAAGERERAFDLDVDWHPIAGQARLLWTIVAVAFATPVLAGLTALLTVIHGARGLVIGLVAAALALALLRRLVVRRHRAWGYALRTDDLVLRRGLLIRRLTIVPVGRMQFIDIQQGPLDRWLGVVNLRLHTAAAATDATVPMLEEAEASRLRDELLRRGGGALGA